MKRWDSCPGRSSEGNAAKPSGVKQQGNCEYESDRHDQSPVAGVPHSWRYRSVAPRERPRRSGGTSQINPGLPAILFAAQRVLQAANRILHLADGFLGLAFRFQLLIAEDLAGDFFHGSLGLLCRSFDSILIHGQLSCSLSVGDNGFNVLFSTRRQRAL